MSARRLGTLLGRSAAKLLSERTLTGQSNQIATLTPYWERLGLQSFASSSECLQSSLIAAQDAETNTSDEARETQSPQQSGNAAHDSSEREKPKKYELVAAFTCNKCGTRTVRGFSKMAYERGVVIARCGGCKVQHLLADRLGWFGEKGSIEDFLAEKGESVKSQTDGTLEVSEQDLLGWSTTLPQAH